MNLGSENIIKLGCNRKCTKLCFRQQEAQKKIKWKQEHQHEEYLYYSKIIKSINSLQTLQTTQLTVVKKQIENNIQYFHQQINKLHLKLLKIVQNIFTNQQNNEQITQSTNYNKKINQIKNKQFNQLTCKNIYQTCMYIKNQVPKEQSFKEYEQKINKSKNQKIFLEIKKEIVKLFQTLSLSYEPLDQQQKNKIFNGIKQMDKTLISNSILDSVLSDAQNTINKSLPLKNRSQSSQNQNSQNDISVQISLIQPSIQTSDYSSRLSALSASNNQSSINSFDLSSNKSHQDYEKFQQELKDKKKLQNSVSLQQPLQFSILNKEPKPKKYKIKQEMSFKKNKNSQILNVESDDQDLKRIVEQIGDQSRILLPQQIQQDPEQQNDSKNFKWQPSRFLQYVLQDLSQQQQNKLAIKMSLQSLKNQQQSQQMSTGRGMLNLDQSSQFKTRIFKKKYKIKRQHSISKSQSNSSGNQNITTIQQIHELCDKLYSSRQKFDIQVKIISIIDITINMDRNSKRCRYKMKFFAADQTGCSIFYTEYMPQIKPNLSVRFYDCFMTTYNESTNYEIQTHCKEIQILNESRQIRKPSFSIILSKINHIKYRWNYQGKNRFHFKVMQAVNLFKHEQMQQYLIKKNLMVAVIQRISKNQYLVGDYTGVINLSIDEKHYNKKNQFSIQEGDTLNIIWSVMINHSKTFQDDKFQITTKHKRCVIYNLRNHNIKFHTKYIPDK